MTAILIQFALAAFGLTAMWCATGRHAGRRKWAPVIGLMGQPAWFYFSISSHAWGLLALSVAYALVYVRGIRQQWGRHEA